MTNAPAEKIQKILEKKAQARRKKSRLPMKMSGASVRQLQRLIINKAKRGNN